MSSEKLILRDLDIDYIDIELKLIDNNQDCGFNMCSRDTRGLILKVRNGLQHQNVYKYGIVQYCIV